MKVLITRLSAHGDVIQTLPLLSALKTARPDVHIGWLVEASAAPLLENHPLIDRLHVLPTKKDRSLGKRLAVLKTLRAERYEMALDVQGLLKSAIWPFLAGIPVRVGYRWTREMAWLFYTRTVARHALDNPYLPTVEVFLRLAGPVLGTRQKPAVQFQIPPLHPDSEARAAHWLEGLPGPVVALAPATIWPSKHWPEGHWAELMQALQTQSVLVLGAEKDRALVNRLVQQAFGGQWPEHWRDLTGHTTLKDLYALFAKVAVFIGPDSAPLHIANAVGHTRIVGLYGPTAPGRTGPIGPGHVTLHTDLACQPCFKKRCPLQTGECLTRVTPAQVLETLATLPA
jgi:heptosyltransferase-1